MGCGASTAPCEIIIKETKASPRDSSPRDSSPPGAFAAIVKETELPTKKDDEVPNRRDIDLTASLNSSAETDLPDNNPELRSSTKTNDSDSDCVFSDEDDPSQKDGASPDADELQQKKLFNEERRRSKTEFELSMAKIQADMEAGQASRIFIRRKSTHDDVEMQAFRGDSCQLGTEWRREDRMARIKTEAKSRLKERRPSCGEGTVHDVEFKLYLQQRRNEMMSKRAQLEEVRETPILAHSTRNSNLAARRAHRASTMPMITRNSI